MRIDDDSSSQQQQPHAVWRSNSSCVNSAIGGSASVTIIPLKHDPTNYAAGKILFAIAALIIFTFIAASSIVVVGESLRQRQRHAHNSTTKEITGTGSAAATKDELQKQKQMQVDEDEVNDAEIYRAVVQSMAEWSKISKRKLDEKRQRQAKNDTALLSRVKRDEEIVCYGELGCFRDEGPFDYLDMLPSPPEEVSTKFLLYTRKNMHTPQIYSYFNFTSMSPFKNCHFNSSHVTKIIIHGFGSTCNQIWAAEIRMAILTMAETNVICVDWENGAALPNYVRAAVNTRLVGKQVALLIFWLNKHFESDTKDFHLIGFSLGAHVAGFAGQELKNLSRITGLDPAGPLFESYDPKVRLDSSDALFVDVIHSNGDSLLMGGLGSWEPMGHVDFYPNGGRVQKGCSNLFLGAVRDFLWAASDGDGRSLCNHRRAYKFFTESVSPKCSFPAFTCDSYDKFLTGACFSWDANRCGSMGYYADQMPVKSKGILYLLTREDEPFCANQYRVTIESSPSPVPITTYGGLEAVIIGSDFINETFLITTTTKDSMIAGSILQKLVVAHPAITEPMQIQLKYTAYQGWLYQGIARWSMDSLIITNAYGKSLSFCTRLLLPSGIPVTIRLTPGICLNRFTDSNTAGAASGSGAGSNTNTNTNAIGNGRPQFPLHSYDTYPGDNNGNSVMSTENSTSTHHHHHNNNNNNNNNAAITADMELSLMKPPRVILNNHHGGVHGGGTGTGTGGEEVIGPPYHVTGSVDNLDWSQWRPVSEPSWAVPINRTMMGTPVVLSPASDELGPGVLVEEADTESTTVAAAMVEDEELVGGGSGPKSSSIEEEAQVDGNHLHLVGTGTDFIGPDSDLTQDGQNQTDQEQERPRPTDPGIKAVDSGLGSVSIQICHFVKNPNATTLSSSSDSDAKQPQQMNCVYPENVSGGGGPSPELQLQPTVPVPELDKHEISVMSNNALGQISSFAHIVDDEQEQLTMTTAGDVHVDVHNETSSASTLASSTSIQDQDNNPSPDEPYKDHRDRAPAPAHSLQELELHQTNDLPSSAQIPAHLQFILQQLEDEGLGPGGPAASIVNNYHDGRQLRYGHGRVLTPMVFHNHINSHHFPTMSLNHDNQGHSHSHSHHNVEGQLIMRQQQQQDPNPNPTMKHRSSSSSSGSNIDLSKTPNPSSRALKHRPVTLSSSKSARRSRIIDVSGISLTPEGGGGSISNGYIMHHQQQQQQQHYFSPVRLRNSNSNPNQAIGSNPNQLGDNQMLASSPGGSVNGNSAPSLPRRIPFRSRIAPPASSSVSASAASSSSSSPTPSPGGSNSKSAHPSPLFYVSSSTAKQPPQQQPQQMQGYYLFSHVPPAQFRDRDLHYLHSGSNPGLGPSLAAATGTQHGPMGVFKNQRFLSPGIGTSAAVSVTGSVSNHHPIQSRFNTNQNPSLINMNNM